MIRGYSNLWYSKLMENGKPWPVINPGQKVRIHAQGKTVEGRPSYVDPEYQWIDGKRTIVGYAIEIRGKDGAYYKSYHDMGWVEVIK